MKHLIFLLSCFLILSAGCDDEGNLQNLLIYDDSTVQIYLNEVLDARCPIDVLCFWEGNAEVHMLLMANGQSANFVLNTYTNYDNSISVLGYDITLNDVLPYPVSTEPIPEIEDYIIDLAVN